MGTADLLQQGEEPLEPPICGSIPHNKKKKQEDSPTSLLLPERGNISGVAHTLNAKQVASVLESKSEHGLKSEEAVKRLLHDGPNAVEGAEGLSVWKILLRQVSNSLTLVLTITLALSFGIDDYIEGGVIAAVICLNVVVGFVQDYKAEKQIAALLALSAPEAKVIRDGTLITVQAEKLVVGDVVHLSVGGIVPADLRLIDGLNLSMDEALLTGESMTILKKPHMTYGAELDMAIGDRKNMAYSGSSVTQGRGAGFIIATGMSTEVGKIAELLRNKAPDRHSNVFIRAWQNFVAQVKVILGLVGTPLTVSLSKFALLLFALAITLTIIVFSANKWNVTEEVLIYGICVAVAIVPESLIAVLTITVAVGTKEMAKGNVIVRKLASLEAVGGVTNICSDKTGTLTQGKMVASRAWIPGHGTLEVIDSSHPHDPSSGYIQMDGLSQPEQPSNPLSRLLRAMALCNLASVYNQAPSADLKSKDTKSSNESFVSVETAEWKAPGDWKASGEPTEIALQVLAMRFGLGKSAILSDGSLSLVAEYPFESATKRMTTVYRDCTGGLHAFSKGATEILLNHVSGPVGLKDEIKAMADEYAGHGLRVLSIAYKDLSGSQLVFEPSDRAAVEIDLDFLGLVGIHDPPRPESAEAVRRCQIAGIKVHMLTGDHIKTATAIAQSVGILGDISTVENKSAIMSAHDFDILSDDQLDNIEHLPLVVARCSPSTKVRMVEAMHRRGAFCVMTGDGVNDAPALKRANVGIAMGQNGSDVAKQAADMVVTDDNFASIAKAVEEGRRLFDNIQKFLMHLLISNIAQVFLLLIGLAFRDAQGNAVFPLSPIEILWVNLITSSFLALGLGLEDASHDIMLRKPHNLKIGVFTKELIVDKMIYGTFMGGLCIAAFTSVAYGAGNGALGEDCNNAFNDTCNVVYRARATTYATLTFLLLITAWEVKHFKRSLFNMDPEFKGPSSILQTVWKNRFLFWAVTAGFALCFPIVYLPVINKAVFKHSQITWEWGIVVACLVVYVALMESWKAIKRTRGKKDLVNERCLQEKV